jgi:hypothetical protein
MIRIGDPNIVHLPEPNGPGAITPATARDYATAGSSPTWSPRFRLHKALADTAYGGNKRTDMGKAQASPIRKLFGIC